MVDDVDKKLIEELEKDGRAIYSDLANKLGVGISTIARQIERLRENDIIKIVALPNVYKLGCQAPAINFLERYFATKTVTTSALSEYEYSPRRNSMPIFFP